MTAANSRPRVVRNQERYASFPKLYALDFGKLVFRLFSSDTVDGEATFGIIDEAEVFAGLFDRYDIHKACGICRVGAHFSVDLDQALHNDSLRFAAVEGILQSAKMRPVSLLYSGHGSEGVSIVLTGFE